MIRTLLLFFIGAAFCLISTCGPARAEQQNSASAFNSVALTSTEVCAIHAAIRTVPWSFATCEAVANAFAATAEPRVLAAICLLESDWRAGVVAHHPGKVVDVGLCGVRCVRGKNERCMVGPATGLTQIALKDPVTNVHVAGQILAQKRRVCGKNALSCYLGRERVPGQRAREVAMILAAFEGVLPARERSMRDRVLALASRTARAVRRLLRG
jgi:hypothetical protein